MKLTNQDIRIMNDYNERYGSGSDAVSEHIIKHWTDAKDHHLFKLFGDKLIYEKEITYGACADDQEKELALNEDYKAFKEDILSKYTMNFGVVPSSFAEQGMPWPIRNLIHSLIATSSLISNRVPMLGEYTLNGKRFKVQQGAKTLRTLRKILIAFNYDNMALFEKMQTAVSVAIDKKIQKKGTLCISIHPMDYFTMSDNEHGWDSCMSWRNDGGHREGTVACLGGRDCVVAYIKSDKDSKDYGWNSKKWRQLIAINEDCIVTNRHYPNYRGDVQREVINMLRTIAKHNMNWEYELKHRERVDSDLLGTGIMYNDFCNSDTKTQIFNKLGCADEKVTVALASYGCCMTCGGEMEEAIGYVECYDCRGLQWCSHCESYECGEFYTVAGGDCVCEYCLGEHFIWCDECQEYHCQNDVVYLQAEDIYVCIDCVDNYYKKCDNCGQLHHADRDYEDDKTICVDCEEILEDIVEGRNP